MDCIICHETILNNDSPDNVQISDKYAVINKIPTRRPVHSISMRAHVKCVKRPDLLSVSDRFKYLEWKLEQERTERLDLEKRMLQRFATIHAGFTTLRPEQMHSKYVKALYEENRIEEPSEPDNANSGV